MQVLVLPAALAAALTYRVGYWVLATPTFEDALITFTHVRNAAEGLGLTHHLGEPPVHGFTSALSALIPLAGELAATGFGLTLLRVVSLLAAVVTIYFAYRIGHHLSLGPWPMALSLGYLAGRDLLARPDVIPYDRSAGLSCGVPFHGTAEPVAGNHRA